MKKINADLIKSIRDEFMKDYEGISVQELALYEHYEFIPHLFSKLYSTPGIDKEAISDVTLHNLCESDGEHGIIDDQYEERLILMRNNNKMPLGLTIEQFNALNLGYYSWIEYGEYNDCDDNLDVYYYDTECIDGVKTLFELPYFNRTFTILESYLNKKGLVKDFVINTDSVEIIKDFNGWLMSEYERYSSIIDAINDMFENC